MSGINNIIHSAISDFKKEIENTVEQNCKTFCRNILKQAIQNRENAPKKHNFTGNFLNGIVVCLYKTGNPIAAYYSSNETKSATVVKMTFPKKYSFKKDYEGVKSHYNPTIETDEGLELTMQKCSLLHISLTETICLILLSHIRLNTLNL